MSDIPILYIDGLSAKGRGMGSVTEPHPLRVEVPFAMPGDTVSVELGRRKRGKAIGYLRAILTPSPVRVPVRCAHAAFCGGCSLQQMDYSAQLKEKESTVTKAFAEALATGTVKFHPIIAASDPWNYRNKMEFSFSQNKEGERFLGLVMAASRGRVINLTECHLTAPWFTQVLEAVRHWWESTDLLAYRPPSDTGALRTLTLRDGKRTGHKMAMLTVSGNTAYRLKRRHLEGFVEAVKSVLPEEEKENVSIFLRIHQIAKGMPTQFYEMHLNGPDHIQEELAGLTEKNLRFKVSPTSFFQPNPAQAEVLYRRALDMVSLPADALVYDLYCGTATLSMVFAKRAKQVVAIELNPHAIMDAEENRRLNGIENVELICGDVGAVLQARKKSETFKAPDLVIVDPPRAGLDALALEQVAGLQAKQILYISCHPASQAENMRAFCLRGYRLMQLQPVDLFPHTVHVENIAILQQDTEHKQ